MESLVRNLVFKFQIYVDDVVGTHALYRIYSQQPLCNALVQGERWNIKNRFVTTTLKWWVLILGFGSTKTSMEFSLSVLLAEWCQDSHKLFFLHLLRIPLLHAMLHCQCIQIVWYNVCTLLRKSIFCSLNLANTAYIVASTPLWNECQRKVRTDFAGWKHV